MVLWSRFHASSAGDVGKIPNQGTQLLLMRVKEESEKAGLKFNIQKTKIMASGPITSWQIEEEKNGSSDRCSKITVYSGQ